MKVVETIFEKLLNGLVWCKTKKVISEIKNDGDSHTDSSNIAAILCNYFCSIPINLKNQILPCNNGTYKLFLGSPIPDHMEFVTAVAHDEVSITIKSLQNRSYRLDFIPVFVFKFLNGIRIKSPRQKSPRKKSPRKNLF